MAFLILDIFKNYVIKTNKEFFEKMEGEQEILKSIPVGMIYLNDNYEATGKYEIFKSIGEASRITGIYVQHIQQIISPKHMQYTATHKRNGRRVTFVPHNATTQNIKERIKKVQTIRSNTPILIKMIYLDDNKENTEEYEVFESMSKASKSTDISVSRISKIVQPKYKNYTATHKKNQRKVTFETIKQQAI